MLERLDSFRLFAGQLTPWELYTDAVLVPGSKQVTVTPCFDTWVHMPAYQCGLTREMLLVKEFQTRWDVDFVQVVWSVSDIQAGRP